MLFKPDEWVYIDLQSSSGRFPFKDRYVLDIFLLHRSKNHFSIDFWFLPGILTKCRDWAISLFSGLVIIICVSLYQVFQTECAAKALAWPVRSQ